MYSCYVHCFKNEFGIVGNGICTTFFFCRHKNVVFTHETAVTAVLAVAATDSRDWPKQ